MFCGCIDRTWELRCSGIEIDITWELRCSVVAVCVCVQLGAVAQVQPQGILRVVQAQILLHSK